MTQKSKDDQEITALGLSSEQSTLLRQMASHPANLKRTMTEIWNGIQSSVGGKIISKKTTIRPKGSGAKRSSVKQLTPAQIAKLPQKEYDKYWADQAAARAGT